jgi:hypothetical protein
VDISEQRLHLLVSERDIIEKVTIMFFLISVVDGSESFYSADIKKFMSIPRSDYLHHELHYVMIWILSVFLLRFRIHLKFFQLFEWWHDKFYIK